MNMMHDEQPWPLEGFSFQTNPMFFVDLEIMQACIHAYKLTCIRAYMRTYILQN